jgi:hypothetical protein
MTTLTKIGTLYIDLDEVIAIDSAEKIIVFKGGGSIKAIGYEVNKILYDLGLKSIGGEGSL